MAKEKNVAARTVASHYATHPWVHVLEIDDVEAVRRGMQVFNHPSRPCCNAAIQALAWASGQAGFNLFVTEPERTTWADRGVNGPHSFFASIGTRT